MKTALEIELNKNLQKVAIAYGLTIDDLKGRSRKAHVRRVRHIAICVIYRTSGLGQIALGKFFGGRDNATINNSLKRIDNITFPGIEEEVKLIIDDIKGGFFIHQRKKISPVIEIRYCDNQDLCGMYKMEIV